MIKEQCNMQTFILLSKPQARPKMVITTAAPKDKEYISTMKGHRSDTKQLNINIKTLTLSYLRQLQTANELSAEEIQIVSNYSKMPACFQSITYLFFGGEGVIKGQEKFNSDKVKQKSIPDMKIRENIRKYCKNLYRSTFFIKSFFKSSRMHFKNKLIILKYLKKIEYLPFRRFRQKSFQWKNIDFQN